MPLGESPAPGHDYFLRIARTRSKIHLDHGIGQLDWLLPTYMHDSGSLVPFTKLTGPFPLHATKTVVYRLFTIDRVVHEAATSTVLTNFNQRLGSCIEWNRKVFVCNITTYLPTYLPR